MGAFTGKYNVGERVAYRFFTEAVSCQSCGPISGRGVITGTEKANGTTMYAIDDELLVFESEIERRSARTASK